MIGVLDICLANCHNFHNMDGHKWITVVLTEAAIGSKITVQTSVQLKYTSILDSTDICPKLTFFLLLMMIFSYNRGMNWNMK